MTFAFELAAVAPPLIFNVDPSFCALVPELPVKVIAWLTAVSKPVKAAATVFTLPVFVAVDGLVVTLYIGAVYISVAGS